MQQLSDRISDAFRGSKARKIAQDAGLPVTTVQNILSGTLPRADTLLALAQAAGVSVDWLLTGTERPQLVRAQSMGLSEDEYVLVPRYDVQLSAGDGRFIDRAEIIDYIPFTRRFFTHRLARKPDGMIILEGRGDSMAKTIMDRDLVMVDTADTAMASAIWAYSLDDAVMLKRLHLLPEGIEVISDNPAYRPGLIDAASMSRFHPIGRVVWAGRTF